MWKDLNKKRLYQRTWQRNHRKSRNTEEHRAKARAYYKNRRARKLCKDCPNKSNKFVLCIDCRIEKNRVRNIKYKRAS